jgi:hypothetical protein
MLCPPRAGMAARRRFIVTPNAVILPVAGKAALPVHIGGEAVPPGAPEIIMVLRHARRMTGDAVGLIMTGEARIP